MSETKYANNYTSESLSKDMWAYYNDLKDKYEKDPEFGRRDSVQAFKQMGIMDEKGNYVRLFNKD